MSSLLAPEKLKMVVPSLKMETATTISTLVNALCPGYGIDSVDILHEFIAQCAVESWSFTRLEENLNYRADRLLAVFGKRYFRTMIEAERYAHNPEKVSNYVYGGRMGNVKPGDGWLFRGGGLIQMTGRDMYTRYGRRNRIEPEVVANLVRTDMRWAMDSACWVFAIEKRLVPLAIKDDFLTISQRITGGEHPNGMAERQAFYERAKTYLV